MAGAAGWAAGAVSVVWAAITVSVAVVGDDSATDGAVVAGLKAAVLGSAGDSTRAAVKRAGKIAMAGKNQTGKKAAGKAKGKQGKKRQVAQRAQRERRALQSLEDKRSPYETLLREIVGAVLHAHGPSSEEAEGAAGSPQRWIEVGSGIGQLRGLLPEPTLAHVTHTELSGSLVKSLLDRYPTANAQAASVTQLPFDTGSLDAVLGLCVVDSLPDPEAASREIHRVLRPGGRFIHFLDAATNVEPHFVQLVESGLLPLPNFFADMALRKPELLTGMNVEPFVQPYHDLLVVPMQQFIDISTMLRQSSHPMARLLDGYAAPFIKEPLDSLQASRAFVRISSDPKVGRPINQALMSLYSTLQQPAYAEHLPFELAPYSTLARFKQTLDQLFGPEFGYEPKLSTVVFRRQYEPDEEQPLRARVRRVGMGQNCVDWPAPIGTPAHLLDPKLPSDESAEVSPASHILREAAIYCLVAEKQPA